MADERFTDAVRTKNLMASLVNSEGWKLFISELEVREKLLMNDFLNLNEDMSDVKLRELRMAIINIRLAFTLPAFMLEVAEETIIEFSDVPDEDEPEEPDFGDEEEAEPLTGSAP